LNLQHFEGELVTAGKDWTLKTGSHCEKLTKLAPDFYLHVSFLFDWYANRF
jgi:hypothetical protein